MFQKLAGAVSRSRTSPVGQFGLNRVSYFHSTSFIRNGNVLGEITQASKSAPLVELTDGTAILKAEDDVELQEYHRQEALEKQIRVDKYITPLKRQLFDLVVTKHGFYKNNTIITDPNTNSTYKVSLTDKEIELLEPSIYLSSYRIKSSMKKATLVNRMVRGYTVKAAINQLHFNHKKVSTELEQLLKRGLEQARELNLDEDKLFIDAVWTGSDGNWQKRIDIKARSRMGIIKHPFIHIKVILKSHLTKLRISWEKNQKLLNEKPRMALNNEPLNFSVRSEYKW